MSDIATGNLTEGRPGFIAYEYTTVKVDRDMETLYKDAYGNYGWAVDGYGSSTPGAPGVTLKFKRDRRIENRAMVLELQRKSDAALQSISDMERQKSVVPTVAAVSVGVVGSAFLAGSVFALEADHLVVSIILGAVGLLGWLAGYVTHGRVKSRKIAQLTPQIDAQYDVIYATGEQASRLLG